MRKAAWLGPLVVALAFAGCGTAAPTPKDQADATRAAMPGCRSGDAKACGTACSSGGPNEACKRACDAGDAVGCANLAARLDHGKDADDVLAPVKDIGEQEPELVTQLFARACELGRGETCMIAAGRILNGQGRGKLGGDVAVSLLKRGCEKLKHGLSCCAMATLNQRLAESKVANTITDFAAEAKKWRGRATALEVECPAE